MNWTLFRVVTVDENRLTVQPVLPRDNSDVMQGFYSSLSADGQLWIPAAARDLVSLGEQSVMMRVENGAIHVFLRNVLETLGFRP